VVVENKAGASGNIGTQVVARSVPDGHTLLLTTSPFTQNVSLFKNVPYDPVADFAPIVRLTDAFMALAVHPSVSATTVQEFVAYLKARPGKLDYASPGRGTPHHLSMELFKLATGTDMKHVAYRGSAPAVQDLVGGHVSAMFLPVHVGLPLAKDNQIRVLAVANKIRVSVASDVPTLPEQGITGVDVDFWLGMLAPAGTAPETIARYNGVLNDILRSPQIAEKLSAQGFVAVGGTSSDFADLIARDLAKWRRVVNEAGITPE
jgi:tripartite-type tricarboxylate transporter receptor subunit TctC